LQRHQKRDQNVLTIKGGVGRKKEGRIKSSKRVRFTQNAIPHQDRKEMDGSGPD